MAAVSRQRVRAAVEPAVIAAGFDLEDVEVVAAGRRSVVRVVVAHDDGIDLDAVAEVSRVVSDVLDASDVTGASPYTLEVTSPGVDRPLTEPRHWRRAVGRLVSAPVREQGTVTGRLQAADEATVTLAVDGVDRVIGLADLGPGRIQVEFNRSAETGS